TPPPRWRCPVGRWADRGRGAAQRGAAATPDMDDGAGRTAPVARRMARCTPGLAARATAIHLLPSPGALPDAVLAADHPAAAARPGCDHVRARFGPVRRRLQAGGALSACGADRTGTADRRAALDGTGVGAAVPAAAGTRGRADA